MANTGDNSSVDPNVIIELKDISSFDLSYIFYSVVIVHGCFRVVVLVVVVVMIFIFL